MTDIWEQGEWSENPVPFDTLAPYIAAALRILRNCDIPAEGVTSPGAFGKRKEIAYAKAVLDAAMQVNNNPRPVYFLNMEMDKPPEMPIRHVDKDKGIAIASIIG